MSQIFLLPVVLVYLLEYQTQEEISIRVHFIS